MRPKVGNLAKVSVFDPDSGMKTEILIAAAPRTLSSMPPLSFG
jgi:hypothetical protein